VHSLDPTEDFAIVLVRRFLGLCEHPRTRQRTLRMVRDATKLGADTPRIIGWINRAVLHPAAPPGFRSLSTMKVQLIAMQLFGLAWLRYIHRIEPVASAPLEDVVRLAAPSIAAALRGEGSFTGVVAPPVAETPQERRFEGTQVLVRAMRARVRG
jgi:hypothetical protein